MSRVIGRLSHDDYFLIMARIAGLRGTCARRTVGCVLVDRGHCVIATGYNGVPAGEPHCIDHPCEGADDPSGNTTRCRAIHAEVNACRQAVARSEAWRVTKAYVTVTPCSACAEFMRQTLTRLEEVHALIDYTDQHGVSALRDRGIRVVVHPQLLTVSIDLLLKLGERWR